jgi:hypothetical protein
MTEKDFCYWLQGFVELHGTVPTEEQWAMIKDHLSLVFLKVTPTYPQESIFQDIPMVPSNPYKVTPTYPVVTC